MGVGPAASPQALVRFLSTSLGLNDALFAMRLVCAKLFAGAAAGAAEAPAGAAAATRPAAATNTAAAAGHRRLPPRSSVPAGPALLVACRMTGPFVSCHVTRARHRARPPVYGRRRRMD